MSEVNDKQYLTAREVADLLGVKEKTLYSWAAEGRIPSHKFGRLRRFFRSDVIDFIKQSRQGPNNTPEVTA